MKKNYDEKIVVMDRWMYEKLRNRASIGDNELCGNVSDDVHKHVCRFNPVIGEKRKKDREARRRYRAKKKREMIEKAKSLTGKECYFLDGNIYKKGLCIGLHKVKHVGLCVRFKFFGVPGNFSYSSAADHMHGNINWENLVSVDDAGELIRIKKGYWAGAFVKPEMIPRYENRSHKSP